MGSLSSFDPDWEDAAAELFFRRLGSFPPVIRFDRRGAARHVDKKGVTIGRVLGGEGGHPDRHWILPLLMDRIGIGVHERS